MQIALSGEHSHAPGEIAVTLNVFIQRHSETLLSQLHFVSSECKEVPVIV